MGRIERVSLFFLLREMPSGTFWKGRRDVSEGGREKGKGGGEETGKWEGAKGRGGKEKGGKGERRKGKGRKGGKGGGGGGGRLNEGPARGRLGE